MLKVVIDTNIFISTVLGGKVSGKICELLVKKKFRLLYTLELLEELKYVLSVKDLEFNEIEIEKILTFIKAEAIFVQPSEKISLCRDPKDNIVLECALAGKADAIVTGDKDLLSMKFFSNIPILTPRQFLKTFYQEK